MAFGARQEKCLRVGGVGPRLLALAGHKRKRLQERGVGPQMRSAEGLGHAFSSIPAHDAKLAETVDGGIHLTVTESRQYPEAPCPI